jgi:hypothetical protein
MSDLEIVPEGENLMAWRLGRVEKTLETIDEKLDSFSSISTRVEVNSIRVASLEKSRDRMVAAITVLGTSMILMLIQMVFNIVGR